MTLWHLLRTRDPLNSAVKVSDDTYSSKCTWRGKSEVSRFPGVNDVSARIMEYECKGNLNDSVSIPVLAYQCENERKSRKKISSTRYLISKCRYVILPRK